MILLAALAAAGCARRQARQADEATLARAAGDTAPAPLRFVQATPDARVALTLPAALTNYPQLRQALSEERRAELADFVSAARQDRQRFARKGVSQPQPYVRRETWTINAITPNLISLSDAWYDDTGGVTADRGAETRLWDRTHNQMLLQSELFRPDLDTGALDAALCQAVTQVRQARLGAADAGRWSCPHWADSQAALVPSGKPWRAGGLMFLFDPYVIGPYAEGEYAVIVPLSAFRAALAPAWAGDFAGAPGPGAEAEAERARRAVLQ
jgi:hypothetical protein